MINDLIFDLKGEGVIGMFPGAKQPETAPRTFLKRIGLLRKTDITESYRLKCNKNLKTDYLGCFSGTGDAEKILAVKQ